MKIDCIKCGNLLKLPESASPNKYSGDVYCSNCALLIRVKLNNEKIEEYKVLDKLSAKIKTPETFRDFILKVIKEKDRES